MARRGEIYSSSCYSKERTYFFNIHENFRNEYSLSLIESKPTEIENKYLRQSVLVYEEDFDKFLQELQKAVDVMKIKIQERDAKNKNVRIRRKTPEKN